MDDLALTYDIVRVGDKFVVRKLVLSDNEHQRLPRGDE